MMKKFVLAGFLSVLMFIHSAGAQVLTAQTEQTRVPLGEVFTLTLSFDGAEGSSLQPDLSVLRKDFTVYSTSTSSQVSIINGKASQQYDWDIGLMPKNEGTVTIPVITAGKYHSKPLTITVLPAGSSTNATTAGSTSGQKIQNDNQLAESQKFDTFVDVDKKNPYLQQEVNVTLTIRDKIGLELTAEPQFVLADNWIVKALKKPEVTKSGNEQVIKFYYALFPQKSGKQDIPAIKINGYYVDMSGRNQRRPSMRGGLNDMFQIMMSADFDSMFGLRKPVELFTKPVAVNVKPAAEGYGNSWWLPAENLSLQAAWSEKKPLIKVGETVSREITLTAVGVADTQLPELELADTEAFKQYPETPQLRSEVYRDKVVSEAKTRVVYIPQKGGEQMLPEIRLPWFNVKSGKIETAVIPAEKVFVEGSASVAAETKPTTESEVSVTPEATQQIKKSETLPTSATTPVVAWGLIIALAAGAFGVGLLLSWFLFRKAAVRADDTKKSASAWCGQIKTNLENKDYRALRDNLLKWGNTLFERQTIDNLNDLAEAVGDENFGRQLQLLNSILYGGNRQSLQADIILQTVKNCRSNAKKTVKSELLPKLYK